MGQTLIVITILLLAVAYIGSRLYSTARAARSKGDGCAAGCGCEAPAAKSH